MQHIQIIFEGLSFAPIVALVLFQMVSLLKLAEIAEEGVKFRSPYDDSECMLTPERSIEIQVSTFYNPQMFV